MIVRQILVRGWKAERGPLFKSELWSWYQLQHLKRCHINNWVDWICMKQSGANTIFKGLLNKVIWRRDAKFSVMLDKYITVLLISFCILFSYRVTN